MSFKDFLLIKYVMLLSWLDAAGVTPRGLKTFLLILVVAGVAFGAGKLL